MANNGQGKDTLQKLLEDCGITNEEVQLDLQQEHDQDEAEALPLQPLPASLNAPAEYFTVQTGTTGQHSAHIMGQRAVLSQIPGDRSKNVISFANNVTTGLVASKPHVNQRVPTLITLQSSNGGSAPVNQKLIITQVSKPVATTTRTLYLTPTTKLLTSSGSNGQPGSSTATLGGSPVVLGASSMQVQQVNSQQKMNSYVLPGQGIVLQPKSQMPLSVPLTNQAVRAGSSGAQKPTVCLPKPGSSNVLLPKKFRVIGPGTHVITPATVTGLGGAAGDLKRFVVKAPQATALSLLSKQRTVPGIVLNAARLPGAEVKTVSPSPSPGLSHSNMRSSVSWDGSRSLSNSPVLSLGNIPAHVTQSAASARNSPAASARNSPAASARNSPAASGSGSTGNPMKDEGMVMRAFKNSKINSQARDELAEAVEEESEELGHAETYADYKPRKVESGLKHPDQVVESSSLASVEPPDVFYRLAIPESVMDTGLLSSLQLEAITYACQRHESLLHNKERAGYFIGDGAGVGKGRTVAGIIHENYILGRKKALWLSVSNDLKVDAERDLCDIGASNIKVYSLNKFKYAKISSPENGSVKKGVLFLTYSSLIGESSQSQSKYRTRLKQIIKWFGKNFDGAIIFDECHKAKNLCPTGSGKPTKTGSAVLELQNRLPNARVVYASATGATEPKNMAYMTRLGMWGPGTPFGTFTDFINCLEKRGVGAMELVAMEMKLSGMYIARQLSFKGVSFKILESHMDEDFKKVYDDATLLWMEAKSMFQKASELNRADSHARKSMWAQFWATHQRFFKHMCISGKVDHCVQLAQDAVADGKCVVIGLQSTGEARTQELVDQEGSDMVDFFSTCKGLFTNLVEKHFPAADPSKTFDLLSRGFCGTNSGFKRKSEDILGSLSKRAKQEEEKMDTDSGSDSESDSDSDLDSAEDFLDSADDSDYERDYDSRPIQWFDGGSDSDDSLDDDETSKGKASIKGKGKGKKSKKSEKKKKKKKRTSDDEADDFCDKKLASIANLKKSNTFAAFDSNSIKDDPNNENGMFRALQIKKELMKRIEELPLPHNTLDSLVDKLGGPQNVAEMTGRKGRVVQNEDGVQYESRSEEEVSLEYLNLKEKERFMNGEKNIAIISEAASSGISLHADRRAVNQKRRVHITLELPWSADRAIQQFGRTHRSNQVSAPEYVFLISDLAGERRFASTVAKRLESLGALTHGDRRATESRDLSRFNIDNRFGRQALETVMKSVVQLGDPIVDSPAGYTKEKFFYEVKDALEGVGLITICDRETRAATLEKDYTNISKFLNRLLGIPTDLQNALFEYFSNTLAAIILDAKRSGRWDMGILDVGSGQEVVKKLETKVFVGKSATNSARTELSTIQVERGMPWDRALKIWQKCNAQEEGFYTSTQERNGKRTAALVVRQGSNKKKEKVYSLNRPNTGLQARAETMEEIKKKYKKVLPGDAEEWWQKQYEVSASICIHAYWNGNCRKVSQGLPCEIGLRTRQYHVLSGSVLSMWPSVEAVMSSMPGGTSSKMQVVRLRASADEKIVGSLIPPSCVAPLVNVLSSRSSETLVLNNTLQGAVNSLNNSIPPFNSSSSSSAVASSSSSFPSSFTHNGPTQRSNGVGDGGDHSQEAAEVPPPPRQQTELLSMPTLI